MIKVVVVTTTFYKSVEELRFRLACRLVEKAVADGHKVVIVDGSPIPEVALRLRSLGAEVFPQLHKGMGPGRREAFFHAVEVAWREKTPFILWTEPEKDDLIRWIEEIFRSIALGVADIVIPARTKESWETWPAFQVESEQEANAVYNKAMGLSGFDPMLGPVAFHVVDSAKYFVFARGDGLVEDTYIQHYAPIVARQSGAKLQAKFIDIVYPPEQRTEEEDAQNEAIREKRQKQLSSLTTAYRVLTGNR